MWKRLVITLFLIIFSTSVYSELYSIELSYGKLLIVTPSNCALGESMLFYPPQAFHFTESVHIHFSPFPEYSAYFSGISQSWPNEILGCLMHLAINSELEYTEINVEQGGIPQFLQQWRDNNAIESQMTVFRKLSTTYLRSAHQADSDDKNMQSISSSAATATSAYFSQTRTAMVKAHCIYHGCTAVFSGIKKVRDRARHCAKMHKADTNKLDLCLKSEEVQCPECNQKFRTRRKFVMHIRLDHPYLQLSNKEGALSLLPY